MSKEKLIRKFDKQSKVYEIRRKQQSERKWRSALLRSAKGKVLEVAVGAGANFSFYPKDVEVIAVDFSSEMLSKAKASAAESGIRATFLQTDIEALSFPENSFDTIVSTLSFCGYDNPVQVLKSLSFLCKPGGQILLMEHGLSSNRWIGGTQKMMEPMFKRLVGCHLDRDIMDILQQSNVHVHRMERYIFNTIHLVWASPK
ncbi:methyltransferase domain-containing protein [Paenibacillus sp. LMG 31456]|uniref:Methyltransferase domain-containing protein n=1 Tax=Paenibacillus foliorum TaxID=2654974 RepID=A0A972GRM2_9BACL|nr:class I SAM-dependent methyltransferase [Paenibacillus foliorum]NOU93194.1 methyltransferase domain-containing protein [Paenibacillus foliorum]